MANADATIIPSGLATGTPLDASQVTNTTQVVVYRERIVIADAMSGSAVATVFPDGSISASVIQDLINSLMSQSNMLNAFQAQNGNGFLPYEQPTMGLL